MRNQILVLLGACSYGILSTIVVLAYGHGYTLGEVAGSQLLMGTALTWLLVAANGWKKKRTLRKSVEAGRAVIPPQRLVWKQRLLLMAAGIPTGATGLLYYGALQYIPASLAIILLFQFTWIGVMIQTVSSRKRPDNRMLITLAVLLTGTLFAAGILERDAGQFQMWGVILGLLSALSYSLFVLFNGRVVTQAPPASRSAWMMTGGLITSWSILPPGFILNGELWGELLLYAFLLGLFGAFIPPVLFAAGVPHIGEGTAAVLGAAELPVATLMSSFVLGEYVSALQWTGVVLVLLGVGLPELLRERSRMRMRMIQ
ncbi:EamA family transporter [Paenibacillus beijingensis]|uniref:Multidrug transporter n=1 Tax=Paenibacillus beijingensis TaxID=1126833 RepID=A0A0D5NGQ4_9BACL|nr:EamA family transporter [Paenibacillus beijingensis]AJY74117.1 multidrug transporter [Paenibacillus beijingensis]